MAQYSLLPATKPNGEKIEVEEVWLIYTNENHYDALISEDGQIMTLGTLDNIEMEDQDMQDFLEKYEYDKADKTDNFKNKDINNEVKADTDTKKIIKTLQDELNKCKAELRNVQEEKERLKIENRDLKGVQELSKSLQKEPNLTKEKYKVLLCAIC